MLGRCWQMYVTGAGFEIMQPHLISSSLPAFGLLLKMRALSCLRPPCLSFVAMLLFSDRLSLPLGSCKANQTLPSVSVLGHMFHHSNRKVMPPMMSPFSAIWITQGKSSSSGYGTGSILILTPGEQLPLHVGSVHTGGSGRQLKTPRRRTKSMRWCLWKTRRTCD